MREKIHGVTPNSIAVQSLRGEFERQAAPTLAGLRIVAIVCLMLKQAAILAAGS
jgi:hypothetical protein